MRFRCSCVAVAGALLLAITATGCAKAPEPPVVQSLHAAAAAGVKDVVLGPSVVGTDLRAAGDDAGLRQADLDAILYLLDKIPSDQTERWEIEGEAFFGLVYPAFIKDGKVYRNGSYSFAGNSGLTETVSFSAYRDATFNWKLAEANIPEGCW